MPLSLHNNNLIAATLYFVFIAVYVLPVFCLMLPQPFGMSQHQGMNSGALASIVLICLAELACMIGLGIGIYAGKTWAKVVYGLFLAFFLYHFSQSASYLLEQHFWTTGRDQFALLLVLVIAFFLFRDTLTRRAAAGVAESGHNRVS
ncbi:hypothetical protein [Hymenobacter yonginensis]|uniref:DoxX family protein n=1 Tax=Hymenobacter yonginensis TaxID=748197 RepID=A0ABY7PTN1_9BACT|nr:hypothetical protein [Hymenobacter yonginensis]WBO86277.1 hypothetical protein O9Z63_08440 [Hymenobacter yonginensis]